MKKTLLFFFILFFVSIFTLSSQSDFPKLTGPYLGQKPPGMTPEIFAPGIVSRDGHQARLNISSDQHEIIFWERSAETKYEYFVRLVKTGNCWNPPEIMPFSTEFINNEPAFSPDGLKLFFVSNRPKIKGREAEKMPDIWYVEKEGANWGEPKNIGLPINGESVEVQPFMSKDDNFYFCMSPGKIFCSKFIQGKAQTPVELSEKINQGRVSGPWLPPDCSYMLFHSKRENGNGGWDLYISFKNESGNWMDAKNLEGLNTPADEAGATISPDGKYIFFTRDGEIYWVDSKIIEEIRPKQ